MIFGRISHTFNPSTVIGGTSINFDEMQSKGTHLVKTTSFLETIVHGDIRCLTNEQIEATVSKMKQ
jgi:glutamate carboxypeptidase